MQNDEQKFIGREISKPISGILNEFSGKINELTNMGAKILIWDLEKQVSGAEYLVPAVLFLRNQLEIIESIASLLRESLVNPSKIFLRCALETYLQLSYLLDDERERGSAFIVWNTHRNIKLYKKMNSTTEEYQQLHAKFKRILL